ncbi:MAG: N-acetylneuraminate synthase family protein [Bryobacterales bacterium]
MWLEGTDNRCRIIAEVGQNHDGSLGAAHAYIDAVARAGADTIKFQTHIAAAESTAREPWRKGFSLQDKTRFDYWKRMEFTAEQWRGLAEHAREKGLSFLSSAFSVEAVELLESLGMEAWKVGAGEITNLPMLERMARTGKPVLLSSGLAAWSDLDTAVALVRACGAPVAVLQCTTMYPCPPERIGLNMIAAIRERYGCPTGLSDHSGKIYAGLAAAALGANVLEVHVTFSKECFGPDVPASLTTAELAQLAEGVRFLDCARAHPVDKEELSAEMAELRRIFGKSVVAARVIPEGRLLTVDDLTVKKPGVGIPAAQLPNLIGRRTLRALSTDAFVAEEDLAPASTA